jgi:hypothetical protein
MSPIIDIDPVKAKEEFKLENERYVIALKGVTQVSKERAKYRNLQAVENL